MAQSLRLRVWGDYACFTRPEMKVERVSYDVMTPSAARGILEAIHWKPAIRWRIDRIHVLSEIKFQTIRRNEVGSRISADTAKTAMGNGDLSGLGANVTGDRQQRATMALYRPDYVIEAHLEMTPKANGDDNPTKHKEMFLRRAERGQCFHRPCLGCREFAANFELVEGDAPAPIAKTEDLGWMLYDLDYANGAAPKFFRAKLENGVVDLTRLGPEDLAE